MCVLNLMEHDGCTHEHGGYISKLSNGTGSAMFKIAAQQP